MTETTEAEENALAEEIQKLDWVIADSKAAAERMRGLIRAATAMGDLVDVKHFNVAREALEKRALAIELARGLLAAHSEPPSSAEIH